MSALREPRTTTIMPSSPIPIRRSISHTVSPDSHPSLLQLPVSSHGELSPPLPSENGIGIPSICITDSSGRAWKSGELQSNGGSPLSSSPSKDSSCYDLAIRSHSASSNSLCDLQNRAPLDRRSLSQGDIRSIAKRRNCDNTFGSSEVDLSSARLSDSHNELEQVGTSFGAKSKRKVKKKFLSVENSESVSRKRSASTGEFAYLPSNSPSAPSRMRKFFQRLRSQSQGDIIDPINLNPNSYNSGEDVRNENSRDFLPSSYEDVPPTAINTGLLSRIRKHIAKQQRRRGSVEVFLKPQRRNSDLSTESPGEENEKFEEKTHIYEDGEIDEYVLNIPPQMRERSNSESRISVENKLKKKGKFEKNIVTKFKERHRQKKRDRAGSLPNVLDNEGIMQWLKGKNRRDSNASESRGRSSTFPEGDNKMVYMGDFAIDDYLGENGDNLSLENLVESHFYEGKADMENGIYKNSMEHVIHYRGKSRSMDYTLQRPFDLETLKRKLGERTSSEPSRGLPDSSEVGVGGRVDIVSTDKKGPPKTQFSGPVISYTVQANDTLMSIAARFDTTPSELTKMNRLSTRFLFPGQILSVPDKGGAKENLKEGEKEGGNMEPFKDTTTTSPNLSTLAPPKSPQGGFPKTPANSVDTDRALDKECLEKFLKIQVRHITDGQGVVAGVLLVTPNAVMFDPNVSDPLVIERGPESYGVIAPMEFVVNAALYFDIAHMKVKDTGLPKPDIPKPEIYFGPSEATGEAEVNTTDGGNHLCEPGADGSGVMGGNEESPSKEDTFPELGLVEDAEGDNDSSCSCGGDTRETSAFPKAFEHELLTPISSDASPTGGGAGDAGPQPPPFVSQGSGGELAPIVEGPAKTEESGDFVESPLPIDITPMASPSPSPAPAQNQCDKGEDVAQTPPLTISASLPPGPIQPPVVAPSTNDKKRTTSVTFSTSSESDMPPLPEDEGVEAPLHESRKQKVLKRISYPLSWMESFSTDPKSDAMGSHGGGPHPPHGGSISAPPVGNWMGSGGGSHPHGVGDMDNRQGMFSNVFSMSNVSNMITRRTSLDFVRKSPMSQGSESPHTNSSSSPVPVDAPLMHHAHKRAQFKDGPKFGLKSMVSMDEMPDLFASFDKLIPKPASTCEESPLYLCLRMGMPFDKDIPRSTPIMTYGRKTMKPEYWFSIPKDRTDELYHFFQIWASEIYGELNEEAIKSRGFKLIEEEAEICPRSAGNGTHDGVMDAAGELREMTKESWEVVSMSEELRKALYSSSSLTSLDIEVFLPEIQGSTEIVDDYIRKNMYRHLPARVQGYNWKIVFSSAEHGFSLKSLYRKMSDIESSTLLFIQDTNYNKFGAFLSCPLRVSELFYGNGECFLFVCQPEFKIFPWTGENTFFAKGNNESLYVGGGDGKFAIWLDGDLYQGRTQPCKTFGNPILTTSEDFIIKTIECWYFD